MGQRNKVVQSGAAICMASMVESAASPQVSSFQKLCPRICNLLQLERKQNNKASKDEATVEAVRVAGEDGAVTRPTRVAAVPGGKNKGQVCGPICALWSNAMYSLST